LIGGRSVDVSHFEVPFFALFGALFGARLRGDGFGDALEGNGDALEVSSSPSSFFDSRLRKARIISETVVRRRHAVSCHRRNSSGVARVAANSLRFSLAAFRVAIGARSGYMV
jgi:hypothetical protein